MCACAKSQCEHLLPEAVQMMRDDDLHASTLLRNNESAVIAWAKNSRLVVILIQGGYKELLPDPMAIL